MSTTRTGFILSLCVTGMLAGCASATPARIEGIQIADDPQVVGCAYLDTVSGTSGWYGWFGDRGTDNARIQALGQARAIGATHVVWLTAPQTYGSTRADAKAYRCR